MNLIHPGLLFLVFLFSTMGLGFAQSVPIGALGLPLGTFAVVEGTYHSGIKTDGGWQNFSIEKLNGKKMEPSVGIGLFDWEEKMTVGKRYVLHGYESAFWSGAPPLPPNESESIQSDWRKETPLPFALRTRFWVTSIEKENGVTLPDARLLDPGFSLAEPKFGQPPTEPPVGVLGLPLGTYVVITVGAPRGPTKGIECEVLELNGKTVDHRTTIAVPFFEVPSGKERAVLHGFESGDWRGATSLPTSETKEKPSLTSSGISISQGLEFRQYFIMTNWTNRLPANPAKH